MFEYQNNIILGKEKTKNKAIRAGIDLLKRKYTDYFDNLLHKMELEFENKEIIIQPLENYTELIVEYTNTPIDKKDEIWLRQREPYTIGVKPYYSEDNTVSKYVVYEPLNRSLLNENYNVVSVAETKDEAYKKVLELFRIKSIPEFLRKSPYT